MMRILKVTVLILFVLMGDISERAVAQKKSDGKSSSEYRRTGIHDGNLVLTRYSNFGNLGSRYEPPKLEWPKGSGFSYGFEFIMVAGAEVMDDYENVYHICSESYTHPVSHDISPDGTHTYSWEPLPGYFNDGSANIDNFPAMSHKPETWPKSWPHDYPGLPGTRDGLWNGEFGAYTRADQESYYVIDDRNNDEFDYYPFVGSPEDSADYPIGRRGLGFQVKVRGYQWAAVEAEDILIVRYDLQNVSDKDLDKVVLGMYIDPKIGDTGDSNDDNAYFDTKDDITYCWDGDGIDAHGRPGLGYFGFAFLESPGDPLNGVDDDEDGLVDERQDNDRGVYVLGPIGNFGKEKWHWSGDEDGDWQIYDDTNGNGKWDEGELIFDDVGSDGIGPTDQNYPGPDVDGTEANGMPDQGEPDFGKTDNDEADQIGLTSVLLVEAQTLRDDERTWNQMTPGLFVTVPPYNLAAVYGSGYFSLPVGGTRKFAIACLFGNDYDDILRNKRTMQRIYDADYSFTKPPLAPTLTAVAGDGKVMLTWDKVAERSVDPIYGKDFEGYLIYRSTDPAFNTIKTITDSYGNPIFWQPIAQFDLKDGLKGPHPVPVGESGALFNTGDDTGLQYYFIDEGLENGRTYYYAVCSYDKGYGNDFYARGIVDKDKLALVAPSECGKTIQTDLLGNVTSIARNCAVVVPNAPSAGYVAGSVDGTLIHRGLGTGVLDINVMIPNRVKDGHTYRITFKDDSTLSRNTSGITIKDITENKILYSEDYYDETDIERTVMDGLHFEFHNDSTEFLDGSWKVGNPEIPVLVELLKSRKKIPFPEDFEIRVKEADADTSYNPLILLRVPVNFEVWNTTRNEKYQFLFSESVHKDSTLNEGDEIVVIHNPVGFRYNTSWRIYFPVISDGNNVLAPEPGDIYEFHVKKPFNSDDIFEFTTVSSKVNQVAAKNRLENIYVVPDPYVVTASWEKPLYYSSGRGERRIDFVNLPQRCTIRIFTVSGRLIRKIEHNGDMTNGSESWDLITEDGLTVSYGVYIYHVEAPELGSKIGKFALIK